MEQEEGDATAAVAEEVDNAETIEKIIKERTGRKGGMNKWCL